MIGFPSRLTRLFFGPKLIDEYPVENPETQIPAKAFNALFGQVAGLNVASITRAVIVAEWDTGTSAFVIRYQDEAWNTDGAQPRPVLARTSAGVYTLTFAATYLDADGVAVPTVLVAAKAAALVAGAAWADVRIAGAEVDGTNPLQVNVSIWNPSGTPALTDAAFVLEVA